MLKKMYSLNYRAKKCLKIGAILRSPCVKLVANLFFLLLPVSVFAEARVIPEKVLNSWGYKTTSIDSSQHIKSIKKANLPRYKEIYYPKFSISKTCFGSNQKARQENQIRIETIKNSFGGGFKTYRNTVIEKGCLYEINTGTQLFYLEFQPEMVRNLKQYVKTN